jgi:hypothetical protein
MTRYTLTYGSIVRVLTDAPEGWDTLQSNIIRNETYHGIFRELNANLRFVTTGAALLRHAYLTEGVEAKVTLRIESYDALAMLWRDIMTAGECDLTQAVDTLMYFECPVIDGGTVALVKANADVKYTIPTPGDTILRYLGVRLYAASPTWNKGLFSTPDIDYLNANHSVPIVIFSNTDATQGAYTMYTVNESNVAIFPDTHFLTCNRDMLIDVNVSAVSMSMTTYAPASYYNGGTEDDRWTFRLYLYHLDATGAVKTTTVLRTFTVIPTQHSGGFYVNNTGGSVNANVTGIEMLVGEKLKLNWRWSCADPDQYTYGHAVLTENTTTVSCSVQAVLPQIDIPAFKAKDLFTSIIAQIDPTATVQSTYLDGLAANEQCEGIFVRLLQVHAGCI